MSLLVKQLGKHKRVPCKGGYVSTYVYKNIEKYKCIYIYTEYIQHFPSKNKPALTAFQILFCQGNAVHIQKYRKQIQKISELFESKENTQKKS